MRRIRARLSVGFAVLVSAAMVAGAGGYLARTTATAEADVLRDFDARSVAATAVIAGTSANTDAKTRVFASDTFPGSAAQLRQPEQRQQGRDLTGSAWYAVLSASGDVLVADPPTAEPLARALPSDPGFGLAGTTGKATFGGLRTESDGATVTLFQPFDSPDGPRVLIIPIPVSELSLLLSGAIQVTGATSYVLDGADRVIVASDGTAAGEPVPDRGLADALAADSQGTVGDTYFATRPVDSGSDWRVVMSTSKSALLAPVHATERVAWQFFAAFAAAIVLVGLIGFSALTSSARLARARLHDALTGLPNRALFLEQADAAIADWRRKRQNGTAGTVAALFLDLDGFKPVNDTYGHAAGDALLKQVAARLVDATRPEDFVSRFGGDEFLVLCRGVRSPEDAGAVADRIRQYLTEPFHLGDRTVSIDVSVGIAVLDDEAQESAALIHNADLALYRAKESGRGRVEFFAAA
jgi:diguanylate cyclase (GGDEF)-like protein